MTDRAREVLAEEAMALAKAAQAYMDYISRGTARGTVTIVDFHRDYPPLQTALTVAIGKTETALQTPEASAPQPMAGEIMSGTLPCPVCRGQKTVLVETGVEACRRCSGLGFIARPAPSPPSGSDVGKIRERHETFEKMYPKTAASHSAHSDRAILLALIARLEAEILQLKEEKNR